MNERVEILRGVFIIYLPISSQDHPIEHDSCRPGMRDEQNRPSFYMFRDGMQNSFYSNFYLLDSKCLMSPDKFDTIVVAKHMY